MNLQKTKIAVGGYQDIVRWTEKEHKEFCGELQKIESYANKALYAPEKINSDRKSLISSFQARMEKRKTDLEEQAQKCLSVYSNERFPLKDSGIALNTVLQYLQVVGENIDESHLKTLLRPIYESNDIDRFNIVSNLLKGKNIGLSGKMNKLSQIDSSLSERFYLMKNAADKLVYLASEEAISNSSDPAKALTQMAVGNTFSGLLAYADETKKILEEMISVSEISAIDDEQVKTDFSFNFEKK